jgi:hypothetical protein
MTTAMPWACGVSTKVWNPFGIWLGVRMG